MRKLGKKEALKAAWERVKKFEAVGGLDGTTSLLLLRMADEFTYIIPRLGGPNVETGALERLLDRKVRVLFLRLPRKLDQLL